MNENGNAYREEMARQRREERNAREQVIFELPKQGPVSWDTLERCAREAGVPMHDWVADALAAYVRFHESQTEARQREAFGVPACEQDEHRRIPAWRVRMGEWAYRVGDWLTEA